MKKILIIVALLVLVSLNVLAENKIAYINSDLVLENSQEGKKIQTIIMTLQEEWNNQLLAKENDFKTKYEEYMNLPVMTDAEYKKEKEAELQKIDSEYTALQKEISQKAKTKQEELLNPILQKLGDVTKTLAIEKDLSAIFDLNISGLVYIDPALDITDEVVEKLNSELSTPAPTE